MRNIVIVAFIILLATGLAGLSAPSMAQESDSEIIAEHRVSRGQTLSSIAAYYYGDGRKWRLIFDANRDKLVSYEDIKVNDVLIIPIDKEGEDDRPSLQVAVGGAWAPYIQIEDTPAGPEFSGSAVEIVEKVFLKAGYEPEFVELPSWQDVADELQKAEDIESDVVASFPYVETPERREKYLLTEAIIDTPYMAFVRSGDIELIGKSADYSGLTFCKQAGYQTKDVASLQVTFDGVTVVEAASTTECFERLLNDRDVDVVTEIQYAGISALRERVKSGVIDPGDAKSTCIISQPSLGGDPAGASIIISKNIDGGEELQRELNDALRSMTDIGEATMHRNKFLDQLAQKELELDDGLGRFCDTVVAADGDEETAAPEARVLLSTSGDYMPYTQAKMMPQRPAEEQDGLSAWLIRMMFDEAGVEAQVEFAPSWSEARNRVGPLSVPGSFPWFDSAEMREKYLYSRPFQSIPVMMFTRAGSKDVGRTFKFASLVDQTLCMEEGWSVPERVQAMINAGSVQEMRRPSLQGCMRAIDDGEADFTIVNVYTGWDAIRDAGLDTGAFCFQFPPVASQPAHLIMADTAEARSMLERFNTVVAEWEKNGLIQRYSDTYRSQYEQKYVMFQLTQQSCRSLSQ
jgi:ABC-type amino acid transport substrate-binding protein